MARNKDTQIRGNEMPAKTGHSLERGESFPTGDSATLAQIVGRRLRAVYPLGTNADEPQALRYLLNELAAKDV